MTEVLNGLLQPLPFGRGSVTSCFFTLCAVVSADEMELTGRSPAVHHCFRLNRQKQAE
jgi:hypothetical protein